MTAKEVLEEVATMPSEEWLKIQSGIAEMLASRFSPEEVSEIHHALAEAEGEFARGEAVGSEFCAAHANGVRAYQPGASEAPPRGTSRM